MNTKWTEEQVDYLINLNKQGKTVREISNIIGRINYAVYAKLRSIGIEANYIRVEWTPEDVERLKVYASEGKSAKEAASLLNRPRKNVERFATKHKIKFHGKKYKWTDNEINLLINLYESGMRKKEISKKLNISMGIISGKIKQMNMPNPYKIGKLGKWDSKTIDKIREMSKHYCISEISRRLNIKYGVIDFLFKKHNIVPVSNPKRWTDEEIKLLEQYVIEGKTMKNISNILNKKKETIYTKLKGLGLRTEELKFYDLRKDFLEKNNYSELSKTISNRVTSARQRSYKMGLDFSIDFDYIMSLYEKQKGVCFYSNIKMNTINFGHGRDTFSISLDRINSSMGYVKGNLALCCDCINTMKQRLSVKEFYEICRKIAENKNLITQEF